MKKFDITPEVLQRVEELSRLGVLQKDIAGNLGLHPTTFSKFMSNNEEFAEAYARGRSKGISSLLKEAWELALHSNNHAIRGKMIEMLLSRCFGYKDVNGVAAEVQTDDNAPIKVTFSRVDKKKKSEDEAA